MIKKAFENKKDILKFKKNYSSGKIETEVILNLINPQYSQRKSKNILSGGQELMIIKKKLD